MGDGFSKSETLAAPPLAPAAGEAVGDPAEAGASTSAGMKDGNSKLVVEKVAETTTTTSSSGSVLLQYNGGVKVDEVVEPPESEKDGGFVGDEIEVEGEEDEDEDFFAGDFVWVKVKSYPWWPGQVYDSGDASKAARKIEKKDRRLVACFGDGTFAWCYPFQMRSFEEEFRKFSKQSSSKNFIFAVEKSLREFGRCVEEEMVCSCLEPRPKLVKPFVLNAGIKEGATVPDGRVKHHSIDQFEPADFVSEVRNLALGFGLCDALELTVVKSRLSAFYYSKGYGDLTEYHDPSSEGISEEKGDVFVLEEEKEVEKEKDDASSSGNGVGEQRSVLERPNFSDDKMHQRRKRRSMAALMAEHVSADAAKCEPESSSKSTKSKKKKVELIVSPPSDGKEKVCIKSVSSSGKKSKKAKQVSEEEDEGGKKLMIANQVSEEEEDGGKKSKKSKHVSDDEQEVDKKPKKAKQASEVEEEGDKKSKKAKQVSEEEEKVGKKSKKANQLSEEEVEGGKKSKKGKQVSEEEEKASKKSKKANQISEEEVVSDKKSKKAKQVSEDEEESGKKSKKANQFSEEEEEGGKKPKNADHQVSKEEEEDDKPADDESEDTEKEEELILTSPRERKKSKYLSPPYTMMVVRSVSFKKDVEGEETERATTKEGSDSKADPPSDASKDNDPLKKAIACSTPKTPKGKRTRNVAVAHTDVRDEVPAGELLSDLNTAAANPTNVKAGEASESVKTFFNKFRSSSFKDGSYIAGCSVNESEKQDADGEKVVTEAEQNKKSSPKKRKPKGEPRSKRTPKKAAHLVDPSHCNTANTGKETTQEGQQAALLLTFSQGSTYPSKEELIKVFAEFGQLNEAETEVVKEAGCARVVFLNSADGEKAFYGSDKINLLGHSVASYRLRFLASSSSKALSTVPISRPSAVDGASGDGPPLACIKKKLESILTEEAGPGGQLSSEIRSSLMEDIGLLLVKVTNLLKSATS